MAFVKSGFVAPPRSLVVGTPARVTRELSDAEIAWKGQGTAQYRDLAVRSMLSMRAVAPLAQADERRWQLRMQPDQDAPQPKGRMK